jgi:glycosyltransferase involved in cell wall biosynthesis
LLNKAENVKKPLIVVPAFNEAQHIGLLLESMAFFRERTIVVNDGCTDETEEIVLRKNFHIVNHDVNRGLSEVYRTAVQYAKSNGFEHIIMLDGDGQHETVHIETFENLLKINDLVTGIRFIQTAHIPSSKIASNLFAVLLFQQIAGKLIPDVSCGFKGFRIDTFNDSLNDCNGFEVIYSILLHAVHQRIPVAYVNIKALYPVQALYSTRTTELLGLLNAFKKYSSDPILWEIERKVLISDSFNVELNGFEIDAVAGKNEYVFKTDETRARFFLQTIN